MRRDILAIDVGTSGLKLGVFGPDLEERAVARRDYDINLYDRDKADVAPEIVVDGHPRGLRRGRRRTSATWASCRSP